MNPIHSNYHRENHVGLINVIGEKILHFKKKHFVKKSSKVKKTFLHFMTAFHNFAIKIETS